MNTTRALLRGVCLAVLLLGLCTIAAQAAADDEGGLFINLTSDDPWKASMAAFFGQKFALEQGHKPVVIFANVQGVHVVHKNNAALTSTAFDKTVQVMLQDFIKAGGKVLVCPVCAKAIGMTQNDLMEGAEMAAIASVNAVLFHPQSKTLNW